MPVFREEFLRALTRRIFVAAGTPDEPAAILADHLVDANLVGHDSHGVLRIPHYVSAIEAGQIAPAARPEIIQQTNATALVNGNWTFGQVSARFGTEVAIEKAKAEGVGLVSVVRCNHIGRVGEYPTLAARQGVAAFVTVGSSGGKSVAPHGGSQGALGTNPISFGFPTRDAPAFLVDFATSSIAGGKVMVARARGEPVPEGTLLNRDGEPTTDPNDYFAGGALLPFGAHKGFGLSMVVALFAGVLTNGEAHNEGRASGGTLIVAIDAGAFGDADQITAAADTALNRIKAVPPRAGVSEVLTPGEPEARARTHRAAEGIPVPDRTWNEIQTVATSLGVSIDP
jgi:hydroxycarboxylate dehydrogenase B